jgi:hypothetical protein
LSGARRDLVLDLLTESLAAWRVGGSVASADDRGVVVLSRNNRTIRIDPAPKPAMFRWLVTIDGRQRPAISIVAVLRQVRQAVDPGYAASRVRITVAPLVPPI